MINTTIAHLDYCLKFLHEEAAWLRKHNAGLFWAEVKIRKLDAIAELLRQVRQDKQMTTGAGYTITTRGCPRRCWFCGVWKKWPTVNVLPIHEGWNVLDDNLLAAPRPHVEAVFEMLRRQTRRVEFTGGLEALSLQDYQVEL